MLEFDIPRVEFLRATPRVEGKLRCVLVTVPGSDPFDLIGSMAVLREANVFLEASGRRDLIYDSSQPGERGKRFFASILTLKLRTLPRPCPTPPGGPRKSKFQVMTRQSLLAHNARSPGGALYGQAPLRPLPPQKKLMPQGLRPVKSALMS
jgi:hypothetical protein